MSTCSTKVLDYATSPRPAVSYGYDRVRFVRPVRVGDTVTLTYEIVSANLDGAKTIDAITVTYQNGEMVAVATRIMKFL